MANNKNITNIEKRLSSYVDFIDRILSHNLPVGASYSSDGNHFGVAKKDVAPTRKDYESLLKRHVEQTNIFVKEKMIILITMITFIFAFIISVLFDINIAINAKEATANLVILIIPGIISLITLGLSIAFCIKYNSFNKKTARLYTQYDEIVKMMLL